MRVIDCEQGSPEWHAARAGKVTASRVSDIMRKTKSGVSAMRATYMGELIAERLSGAVSPQAFKSAAMEWGTETEDQARAYYGFMHDVTPVKVGFVLHPTIEFAAASPDRLIGDDGLLEIKCPNSATHIATLLGKDFDPDYLKQTYWQMVCTARQWCDLVSFDPRMPAHMQMVVRRIHADAKIAEELEDAVRAFLSELDARVAELRAAYPDPVLQAAE